MMRRLGYAHIYNQFSKQESYVRRLGSGLYPRFHLYADVEEQALELNLHLDQKKPSYKGHAAHSAEYSGLLVRAEMDRIINIIYNKHIS